MRSRHDDLRLTQLPRLGWRLAAIWSLLAVYDLSLYAVWLDPAFVSHAWGALTAYVIARAVLWFVVSWILFFLTDLAARLSRAWGLLVVGIFLTAITAAIVASNLILMTTFGPWPRAAVRTMMAPQFVFNFHGFLLWTAMIVALGRWLQIRHARESQTLHRMRSETALTRARASALAEQLGAHFVFNTLTGIGTLLGRDAAMARHMVDRMQGLLSYSGGLPGSDVVALKDELEFVRAYLELQNIRFGDRIVVSMSGNESAISDCIVPRLFLQPLVENAVKYGMAGHTEPVRITIAARRDGDDLALEIRNTTKATDAPSGLGLGLAAVRARLELLFGDAYRVDLQRDPSAEMTTVTVRLPIMWQLADRPAHDAAHSAARTGPPLPVEGANRLSRRGGLIAAAGVWLMVFGTKAHRAWIGGRRGDVVLAHPQLLLYFGSICAAWIALTMLFFHAIQTLSAARRMRVLSVAPAIAVTSLTMVTFGAALRAALSATPFAQAWMDAMQFDFLQAVLYVAIIVAISQGIRSAALAEQARIAEAELDAETARAEFRALLARTPPHFVAQALRRISALIPLDARLARSLVVELGDLLRDLIRHSTTDTVQLDEELELLRRALRFEQRVLQQRLTYHIQLDPAAAIRPIPVFLVHSLVHWVIPDTDNNASVPMEVRIEADLADGELRVDVQSTGSTRAIDDRQLSQRLALYYGDRWRLRRREGAFGGYELRIPVRPFDVKKIRQRDEITTP